jgi:hypothetical protein
MKRLEAVFRHIPPLTKTLRRLLIVMPLLLLSALVSTAENPAVENFPEANGWINWERQVVKAVGHGVLPGDAESPEQAALMARSAAVADAYRNLASMIYGVRVSGDTYVRNFITESDEVRLKVEGFIRGAEVVSDRQLSDKSFEVILQVPLAGQDGILSGLASELLPGGAQAPQAAEGGYTGLVIDARGLGVKPAISPKVYDEDGTEVYGTVQVSPDYAIEVGIAGYPKSIEQALKSPRIGAKPLVVKALRKGSKFVTDVVIGNAEAAKIREAEESFGILSRCRVSILIGPAGK